MHTRLDFPLCRVAILFLALCAEGRLRALDTAAMQAMVIVQGDEGRGSAFVVKMDGKTYLVTNSHVVRGNRNVKFKNLRNTEIAARDLEIADEIDAVRAEIPAVPNALELEPQMDRIKIGDEVVVAGNSEGEGVVREIPGKVVGIGPDRIEVDAEFVPGNSGSPILLKSTGKVIGVATYMKLPWGIWMGGKKNPFSLNQVRRFGYRLDTVAKWIHPQSNDRLAVEGLKLAELDELLSKIGNVLGVGASLVTKTGSTGFVSKEEARQSPILASLSTAIDDFVKDQTGAKNNEDKAKNATSFFARLRAIAGDDVKSLKAEPFSGFYALQLKESLDQTQRFFDWFDGTAMPAYRQEWVSSRLDGLVGSFSRPDLPPIDPAKLKLVLSDRVDTGEPHDHCHHISYPENSTPSNLENLFWIIEQPRGDRRAIRMRHANVRLQTPDPGTYRIYVEYRTAASNRAVSNVVEVKFDGLAATPLAGTTSDQAKPAPRQAPAVLPSGKTQLLSPENIAHWEQGAGEWKIADGVLTGHGDSSTAFLTSLTAPFTLEFKINVLEGMRPRVIIGPVTCGNEGYAPTLALYPPGRNAGVFSYEHNHTYEVSIRVGKDKVELSIDGKLISTGPGIEQEIGKLEFRGGDWWSKGATEYHDIAITK